VRHCDEEAGSAARRDTQMMREDVSPLAGMVFDETDAISISA
jgi:hypothetical protein